MELDLVTDHEKKSDYRSHSYFCFLVGISFFSRLFNYKKRFSNQRHFNVF